MGLSDEERRRLEKLEQELAAADPDLDRKLQSGAPHGRPAAPTVRGILAAIAGFALVIAGIVSELTVVGVLGFALMIAGAHWVLNSIHPEDRRGGPP